MINSEETKSVIKPFSNEARLPSVRSRQIFPSNSRIAPLSKVDSLASTCVDMRNVVYPSVIESSTAGTIEARRQESRLHPFLVFKKENEHRDDLRKSITNTIGLLYSFAVSNLPIPTASVADDNASLFICMPNYKADMEIGTHSIEYYIKNEDEPDGENELYGIEPLEKGRIPPSLLLCLYKQFARY